MEEKIAIQGIKGSFHYQVAQECFGPEVKVDECRTFKGVIDSLLSGRSTSAVMAIENSTAGSILPNFALIDENNIQITGEHYIPINMNLMALPGQNLEDIKEVYSHPIALLQCKNYFEDYPEMKLIEDSDTAEAARRISRKEAEKRGGSCGNSGFGTVWARDPFSGNPQYEEQCHQVPDP